MNTLSCGDCVNLGPTIPTMLQATRPVAYCAVFMTWRLRTEVVEDCDRAEGRHQGAPKPDAAPPTQG
jgi:hypothetical protein